MADCAYTFTGPDGKPLTIVGVPGLKAYLVDGGLEHLFHERKFPLKAVAQISRGEEPVEKTTRKNTFQNQAAAEEHLLQSFGPGIKNLITSKVLNFTQGKASWPEKVQRQLRGGEEAVYVNGKAYIDLQAIGKDRLNAVVLHEIGEHFNLKLMLGPEGYKSLQDQITNRAKIKGSQAEKIWNQVERLYPDLEVGSEAFVSEVIAKLGEANPQAPWYRRLLTRIKAFLVERGLGRGFITGTMTEDDMHDLLRTSLMSAAGRFAQGEARVYSEGVMASRGATINVDGFERPTTNSTGQPIHQTEDGIRNFWRWFGVGAKPFIYHDNMLLDDAERMLKHHSKKEGYEFRIIPDTMGVTNRFAIEGSKGSFPGVTVDASGRPVVFYHASSEIHNTLTPSMRSGKLIYTATSEKGAKKGAGKGRNSEVSELYVSAKHPFNTEKNPIPWSEAESLGGFFGGDYLRENGFDSVWVKDESGVSLAVIDSNQIKSAIGNQGSFSPEESDIRYSRPIENLQPAPEERASLWNRWFGKSKMQRGGEPIKFYHGSQAEFTVFDKSRLATNTAHSTAGLGHFFTEDKGEASRYGGNVKEVFLSVQKPYIVNSWDLDTKFNDAEGATKFREKLQAEGYDGIYIRDAKYAVTFESNRAKLTENQSPTFGEDVRFSRVEDVTAEIQATKEGAFRKLDESWSSVWGQRLSLLSARMIAEYAQKPMPKISKFIDAMQARTAVRDNLLIKGDRILKTKWRTLSRPEILGLNQVMQKSTLQDVNASQEWSGITDAPPGVFKFRVYTQAKLNQDNKNQFANYLKGLAGNKAIMIGQNADFAADSKHLAEQALVFLRQLEAKQAESRRVGRNGVSFTDENIKRLATHIEQHEKFLALPKKAQDVYSETHDLLTEIFDARVDELVKKIDDAIIDVKLKTQLKTELRKQYESKSLSHYYAPLGRKGDNWFYGKDALGNNWFSTFETVKQRDKALEDFLKAGGSEVGQGSKLSGLESLQKESIVSEGFVQQINELLDKKLDKSIGGPIMDEIYDMFLESLPEVSMRHSSQHRQGVLGYNEDQMQSFSTAVHHGASQLANMRHGKEMLQVLIDHREAKDIAEFPRRLQLAEDDIEAADLMAENWDTLSEKGYIEYKMTQFEEVSEDGVEYESDGKFENVSADVWELALQLRNKFGNLESQDAEEGLTRYKERKRGIIEMSKAMKKEDLRKVADVILELDKTYTSIVASTSSPMDRVAAWLKQVNFIYGLGFSLSGGAVNMLQTPIVAMPVSIGRYGVKRTIAAYNEAYKDFASAIKNSYHRNELGEFDRRDEDGNSSLTVELERKAKAAEKLYGDSSDEYLRLNAELQAMRAVKEEGDISRTNSFDLMGIGREGETYGGRLQDFSKWAGAMFHHGERTNREITIRANYRLAFDESLAKAKADAASSGENVTTHVIYQTASDMALKYARQVNNRAHGDYSSENTARIFRSWPAQIALQYKKYPQLMLWVWGTSAMDAVRLIKNRNNDEAREGARTFMALFAMQATFAGALGLPLVGTVEALINGLAALFDDDDEPFDTEEQFRLGLQNLVGNKAAEAITDGIINAFTGVNISSRIALKDIVFREGMVEAEGRDEALQLLGDLGGPTGGLLQRLFEAKHLLNEGKVLRAAENAMPKAISDLLKAGRFFSEDAVSLSDQHVKDMTDTENFLIAAGFGSQELSKVYQERNYVMRRKNAIESTYQSLMHKAATAEQKGDEIDWDSIEAFNEKYPMKQITMDKIRKSIDRREDYAERSEDRGYAIDPKLEFLYEEYDLDESED